VIPGVRLVVLGKQGAGKGTQCVRLSHHYVVPHVSTGDMLRAAVKSRTPLGLRAKEVMDRGELLSDELVMEMVGERLSEGDARARGFVLDGCPRTIAQAEQLADMLAPVNLDLVIDLEVPTAQVLRRLASRRVCVDCGTNYSVTNTPLVNWTCDVCGGEVVQREDDKEEAIARRLELYERQTAPLIDWYREHRLLAQVNGVGPPDVVTRRAIKVIEDRRRLSPAGAPPSRPDGLPPDPAGSAEAAQPPAPSNRNGPAKSGRKPSTPPTGSGGR
jgi:adenylate kinase